MNSEKFDPNTGERLPVNHIERDPAGPLRCSNGKPIDRDSVAEEDAKTKAAKREAKRFEPLPDETQEQYQMRMRRVQRSKMTGAEVMAYDVLLAKFDRQEREEKRLRIEPNPRGEITVVRGQEPNNLQVVIKFDPTHPLRPNYTGEILIHGSAIFQFTGTKDDEGKRETRRFPRPPEKGMTGELHATRDLRDGITLHWSLILDADTTQPS